MELGAVRTTVVVPAKKIREHWLPLSNLDRVVMPTYVRVLLVYNTGGPNKRNYGDLLETLKHSLALLLVDFYPMSGQLGVQEHGLVNLHCNGSGAIFTEAFVHHNLRDLEMTQYMCALSGLEAAQLGPGPLYIPSLESKIPALVVQVTHFNCGNIVIAVNWHHTVADIYSGCHFLRSWTELALGNTQPSLRPIHSRHMVKARNELNISLAERWSNLARLVGGVGGQVAPGHPTVLSAFSFGQNVAESLKSEANENVESAEHRGQSFTTMESVLAHFWRLLAKARRAEEPRREDNVSRLFMFVEGRKYLNLPRGYFGNVVGCACAVSTEESLVKSTLSTSAGLLQSAVAEVSCPEFFQSLIDWVEAQRLSSARHEHGLSSEHYIAATLWTFAPLYDLDFGWGKPVSALTNPAPRRLFDSLVILPSRRQDQEEKALVQIRASCLSRLEADPEFYTRYRRQRYIRVL